MKRLPEISKVLDLLRGELGMESAIDVLLRLFFLRQRDDHRWHEAVVGTGADSSVSLRALWRDSGLESLDGGGDILDRLVDLPKGMMNRLLSQIDFIEPGRVPVLFEECLDLRLQAVGRVGQEVASPTWLSSLELALSAPIAGSVHDPACGFGGGLLQAAQAGATELSGNDINRGAVATTAMRLEVHGYHADVRVEDSLSNVLPRFVDRIVSDPPLGVRLTAQQVRRWGGRVRPGDDTGAWLMTATEALHDGGVATVLTGTGRLSRSEVFRDMVASGLVEAVIQLPPGSFAGTKILTSLVVLSKAADPRAELLVIDMSSLFEPVRRTAIELPEEGILVAADLIASWRRRQQLDAPRHLAVRLERHDVVANGLRANFDTAPEQPISWPEPAARLLKRLRIENLKSFAGPHSVPLAPLTLIYGQNSVGKSTVIQSLLLLLQSVRAHGFVANGTLAHLGTFNGLVSGHDTELAMRVGLDFGIVPPWPAVGGSLHPGLVRQVEVHFSSDGAAGGQVGGARIGVVGRTPLRAQNGEVGEPWQIDLSTLDDWVDLLENTSEAFIDPRRPDSESTGKYRRLRPALKKLRQDAKTEISAQGDALLPSSVNVPSLGYATVDPAQMLGQRLGRALKCLGGELEQLAKNFVYLGPIRPAPERFTQRLPQATAGIAGGYISYLYDNASAVKQVNEWLKKLSIPYSMEVLPVTAGGSSVAVGDLVAVVLTDLRSRVQVSPADVGYGVSQVLPIVVECLRSTEQVICIEQPELHLHPRLQANLAELLVEITQTSGAGNQVIIETHSEHILLRLQRLVREGQLAPEDVAVLYVDQDEAGRAGVQRIRLGDHGEFLDPWPTGFFDDSLDDVLGGW